MAILMSIRPEYADKIFLGIKRFEFRKRIPKQPFKRVYVYSSSPVKKIIGYFDVDFVLHGEPNDLWNETCKCAGIDSSAYKQYFSDSVIGYAIHVSATKLFDMPVDPYLEFHDFKAPQSFMYFNGSCCE